MDLLALIFIWPFLILAVGLVFIAIGDVSHLGTWGFSFWPIWPVVLGALIILWPKLKQAGKEGTAVELALFRTWMLVFSIALLLPIFTRYLVETFSTSLVSIIAALIFGFAVVVGGIFMRTRKVLMYGNIVGGALSILWVYSQLWSLGELPRVIAAGFGLAIAVVVAVIKLKDKLS